MFSRLKDKWKALRAGKANQTAVLGQNKDKDFKKLLLQHRLQIFYRSVLTVVLLAVIGIVVYIQMENHVYTYYEELSEVSRESIEGTTTIRFANHILNYSTDGARCIDPKGNVIWNATYEMQTPMVDICKDMVAFADYNGHTIYVMNTEGTVGEIDTGMPIRKIKVSAEGVVVAILEDSSSTPIYVFSATGAKIAFFKTSMQKSGYPLSISISDDSKLIGVSYLYVDSGSISSKVAFYNFGPVGQNETDNLVSGYDYADAIVPELEYMDNTFAFALADNRLMFYEGDQIPINCADVLLQNEIEGVFHNESYVALVYYNHTGISGYMIDVYNTSGKLIQTIPFDMDFTDILIVRDKVVIYNQSTMEIYNLEGVQKYSGNFTEAVEIVIPTSVTSRYVIVGADSIKTIELK